MGPNQEKSAMQNFLRFRFVPAALVVLALSGCSKPEENNAPAAAAPAPAAPPAPAAAPAPTPAPEAPAPAAPATDTAAASTTASIPGKGRSGEQLYNEVCKTCHESGLLNAPKFGDKAAWAARIAQGKDVLYKHNREGFNAMPARGGAADASDAELEAAVDYLIQHSS